ncbi:RidA family protein [Pseudorhodoplanes sp.]|uniref:RidA family protein n=1 Tax=Pseudorhodoplanes sp. TaxID=1934341 RepID=UPI003D09968C
MKKVRVRSNAVAEAPPGLWSNCLTVGPMIYIAGLTSRAPDGKAVLGSDEYSQSKIIFQKIKDLVVSAGGNMDDIVKLTIFVTNIANNSEVWRARKEFFSGDFPTCSLVEVKALAHPSILIEIEGVAYRGCSDAAA